MEIYKKGQGNKARAIVAIVAGALVVFGITDAFKSLRHETLYIVSGLIVLVVGGGGVFLSFFYKKTVDFLIDTQAEMKKVAWPPWGEVKGSTGVVITTMVIMGSFLTLVDFLLTFITRVLGIFPEV